MGRFTNKIVVITGRNPQSITDVQKELGAKGAAIAADVTKSAELDSLFRHVREKYCRIDVLYANAGIAKLGSVAETSEEVFDDVLDTNFRGAYFTVQKALPLLSDGGAIVFTSSWFAEAGIGGTLTTQQSAVGSPNCKDSRLPIAGSSRLAPTISLRRMNIAAESAPTGRSSLTCAAFSKKI